MEKLLQRISTKGAWSY